MSLRLRGGVVAVVIAVSMHALLSAQSPHGGPGTPLQPGRNINAAGGIVDPRDPAALVKADINAQRQNETTVAASVRNPDHLLAIANDYRFVDFPQDRFFGGQQSFIARLVARILRRPVRKMPPAAAASVGAWTGVYRSCDRGRTWIGGALPGGPLDFSDASNASPLKTLSNAAAAVGAHAETTDPVMVAGPNGRMHIVVLGFARFANGAVGESRMFYASYTDRNNREGGTCFNYDFTRQVDAGSSHASSGATSPFIDKPSIAVDADGTIFTAYTVFLDSVRSRVVIARSTDGGLTWSRTIPLLNAGFLRNHGTTLAIDPQKGTIYVAWRLFYEDWPMMVISRSFDRGRTFIPATPISHWWPTRSLSQILRQLRDARLRPFDQFTAPPGAPATARSLAFPTLAAGSVGGRSRLYAAWTERADVRPGSPTFGQPDANGSPRIMFTMSSDGGWSWTPRRAIDAGPRTEERHQRGVGQIETRAAGPQLQPVLGLSGTADPQLVLMYYESRGEIDEPMATSFISGIERRIDVRAARINPVTGTLLAPSVQVSQYAIKANSAPAQLAETAPGFDAVNRQNLLMYAGGSAAFFGDYPHLAPSRAFEYTGARWRWTAEPGTTVAMWTDSRDVQFPLDASGVSSIYGDWARYTPLVPSLGGLPAADCTHVASRNANPYFSELGGIAAGAPQTFKPLTIQRAFATYVENRTPQDRAFRLTIQDNEGAGIDGSFDQFDFSPASDVRDVVIFGNSSAHRTVWVQPLLSNPTASLSVLVQEIAAPGGAVLPNGLRSRIILNPDPGNDELLTVRPGVPPYSTNPALTAENSELHNPQISTPQIATLRIEAPQISSPQIATPQIATPQIATPQIATPQISTPQISTPQIATPQIATTAPGEPPNGTEITYTVTNQGTTTSTYEGLFNVPNVEELIQSGNYQFQVLITRTSLVPGFRAGAGGCEPAAKTDVEVIANIPVPQIATPQIATISNPQIATPQIATPQIATFSVAPYNGSEGQNSHGDDGNEDGHSTAIPDQVHVTLRAIRLKPMSAGGPLFDPRSVVLRVAAESTNVVLGVVEPEGSQPSTLTRPDVVVANYLPATTPLSAPAGGQVTISSWSLANEGTATAFPSDNGLQVGFYLSTDPVITTTDVLLASLTHNGIVAPGQPVSFPAQTLTIPASTVPGEYYIGILVDIDGGVSELDEGNNFVSEAITIRAADPLCAPVPPGLLAWWPGDGNFYDVVGGRHAASDGVSFADGHVREAFSFNGDGDSLRVADHPALRPSQLTVGFWFSSNTDLGAYSGPTPFLGHQGDDYDAAPRGYDFAYIDGALRFGLRSTAGRVTVSHPVELTEASWHYVAGTFDGRFQRLYLDGVEVGTAVDWNQLDAEFQYSEAPAPLVFGRFSIGGEPYSRTYFFGGLMDEAMVANRALTPAEVAAIHAAGGQGVCRTPESFTATDLSLEQTDSADPVLVEAPFSYLLTVRNLGGIPATNVALTSILSEGADILSAESTRGDCSASEGQVVCTVPALAPEESFTVTVSVRAMAPGILVSDARVTAAQVDPVPANNHAAEGTIVQMVAPCSAATFAGPAMVRAGGRTFGVLAGDLNGDGFVDLVSPVHSAGVVTVFLGNGTGAFGEGTSYAAGPSPEGGDILDLNGDGALDLILDSGSMAVLVPGDGEGGFGAPVTYAFAPENVTDVRAGDFNRDGRPDVAIALNDDSIRVLLATATGRFGLQPAIALPALPATLTADDFDRNGTLDLAVSYEFAPATRPDFISVLLGAGDGTFAPPATVTVDQESRLSFVSAIGDVNGDGFPDLGLGEMLASGNQLLLLLGNGAGGFSAERLADVPGDLAFFTSNDVNGDGHPDLILSAGHTVHIRLGDGDGAFGAAASFMAPFAGHLVAVDLNADRRPDLAVAVTQDGAGGASILLNTCGGAPGELSLAVSDSPDPVDEGSVLTYSATIVNGSSEPASGVAFMQTVPAGAELLSVDQGQGICSVYGSIVSCQLGELAAEAITDVTVAVVLPHGGRISSTAGVTSTRADSNPSDNRAVVDTTVNAVGRALTVTNAHDSGQGSLRQAVLHSNADAGDIDRIVFAVGEGGPATITLQAALPSLMQPVSIDGTTQPGYAGAPIVELNGTALNTGPSTSPNALTLLGGNSTIRGLVINRFGGSAISMAGAGGNVVEGNYLGTNMAGTAALGNGRQGVTLSNAGSNRIGGTGPGQRNVISGNATGLVVNNGSSNNLIAGNSIGTDAAGLLAVPNTLSGVSISGAATTGNTLSGNLISGNLGSGVNVSQGATGNIVHSNLIGVDAWATTSIGNQQNGVFLAAPGNMVGGSGEGAGNVISGNHQNGVLVFGATAGANTIQGNRIGTNGSGTSAIPNLFDGVAIVDAAGTRVGAALAGAGNVISGNSRSGVRIGGSTNGTLIEGNVIGVNSLRNQSVPNLLDGVRIEGSNGNVVGGAAAGAGNLIGGNAQNGVLIAMGGAGNTIVGNTIGSYEAPNSLGNGANGVAILLGSNSTIGGNGAGEGNAIAFNERHGITIREGSGNRILGNRIWSNTGMGIDLGDDGVTLNDTGDADAGANNRQNFPLLTNAALVGTSTWVAGVLNSRPSTTFSIWFFGSAGCDASGHGEGQVPLGQLNVTTAADGNVSFNALFPVPAPADGVVTATVTGPDGDTSEFSACATVGEWVSSGNGLGTAEVTARRPRSGNGSAELIVASGATGVLINERPGGFGPFGALRTLSYDWFIDAGSSPAIPPHFRLRLYAADDPRRLILGWDTCNSQQCRLQTTGVWQTTDLMGRLSIVGAGPAAVSRIQDIPADAPISGLSLFGSGNPWLGHVDNVAIGFEGQPVTVYNFELANPELSRTRPSVTWNPPAAIPGGTALSTAELNASANVPGSFTYAPAAGAVPESDLHRLTVRLDPADRTRYLPVPAITGLTVTGTGTVVAPHRWGAWTPDGSAAAITNAQPRSGTGSLELTKYAGGNSAFIREMRGVRFGTVGELSALSVDWFIDPDSSTASAPEIALRVYEWGDPRSFFLFWNGCATLAGTCSAQPVGSWQSSDLMGRLVAQAADGNPLPAEVPPDAPIVGIHIRANWSNGQPWHGFADNLTIGFGGRTPIVYNFEY